MKPEYFKPGCLLWINDYEFEDGAKPKEKFMVVLHSDDNLLHIIHCLTTTNNKFGEDDIKKGCHEHKGMRFWYYPPNHPVGMKEFCFSEHTYISFYNNIRECSINKFEKQFKKGDKGIKELDFLSDDDLDKLLGCIIASELAPEDLETKLIDYRFEMNSHKR